MFDTKVQKQCMTVSFHTLCFIRSLLYFKLEKIFTVLDQPIFIFFSVSVSADENWHVTMMDDVITDGAKECSTDFAESARTNNNQGSFLLLGKFT